MNHITKSEAKKLVRQFKKAHLESSLRGNWKNNKNLALAGGVWFWKGNNMAVIYKIANGN